MLPGSDRPPRGRTRGGSGLYEFGAPAPCGNGVDGSGVDVRPEAAQLSEAEVVEDDQHDVRCARRRTRRRLKGGRRLRHGSSNQCSRSHLSLPADLINLKVTKDSNAEAPRRRENASERTSVAEDQSPSATMFGFRAFRSGKRLPLRLSVPALKFSFVSSRSAIASTGRFPVLPAVRQPARGGRSHS